ncbi:hypothetical protein B0J11DRAFT_158092 [Dendryphion nanum]|uniref:Uncharacterized protein n=1 Tax=Dendryphion nanum TaxID=256645 RepID=A0A9P9IU04_9PLEO|nr:hypothetical protein B0J11DRAFT_158092 [Dendryphion nanum]
MAIRRLYTLPLLAGGNADAIFSDDLRVVPYNGGKWAQWELMGTVWVEELEPENSSKACDTNNQEEQGKSTEAGGCKKDPKTEAREFFLSLPKVDQLYFGSYLEDYAAEFDAEGKARLAWECFMRMNPLAEIPGLAWKYKNWEECMKGFDSIKSKPDAVEALECQEIIKLYVEFKEAKEELEFTEQELKEHVFEPMKILREWDRQKEALRLEREAKASFVVATVIEESPSTVLVFTHKDPILKVPAVLDEKLSPQELATRVTDEGLDDCCFEGHIHHRLSHLDMGETRTVLEVSAAKEAVEDPYQISSIKATMTAKRLKNANIFFSLFSPHRPSSSPVAGRKRGTDAESDSSLPSSPSSLKKHRSSSELQPSSTPTPKPPSTAPQTPSSLKRVHDGEKSPLEGRAAKRIDVGNGSYVLPPTPPPTPEEKALVVRPRRARKTCFLQIVATGSPRLGQMRSGSHLASRR